MHIVVTSHGSFCTGALSVYEMVAGKTDGICAVSLDFNDTGQFTPRLLEVVEAHLDEGVLILCDIIGGTPYNESFRLFLEHEDTVRVLANMNLPMLLEAGMARTTVPDLEELYKTAVQAGLTSIKLSAQEGEPNIAEDDDLF